MFRIIIRIKNAIIIMTLVRMPDGQNCKR